MLSKEVRISTGWHNNVWTTLELVIMYVVYSVATIWFDILYHFEHNSNSILPYVYFIVFICLLSSKNWIPNQVENDQVEEWCRDPEPSPWKELELETDEILYSAPACSFSTPAYLLLSFLSIKLRVLLYDDNVWLCVCNVSSAVFPSGCWWRTKIAGGKCSGIGHDNMCRQSTADRI